MVRLSIFALLALACLAPPSPAAASEGEARAPVLLEDFSPESAERHLAEVFSAHERRRVALGAAAGAATDRARAARSLRAGRALLASTR